jgi:hypothetical protein
MKFVVPFLALNELLAERNINPDGLLLSLPERDFHRLRDSIRTDREFNSIVDPLLDDHNVLTIAGVTIKPRYGE